MIEIGSAAPAMALEDTAGQIVRLSDYRGKAAVLLFFMRSASCAICNRHAKDLAKGEPDFVSDNVQVLIAVPEGRDQAAEWKAKNDIPFPVVTGRNGSPYEAVGLAKRMFGSMQQSGSILIDSEGVVRHAHGATIPVGSYDKKGIAAAIADLTAD